MAEDEDNYSMESFEPFVSDADSMLIFGAPVEFKTITNENEEDDFFNGEHGKGNTTHNNNNSLLASSLSMNSTDNSHTNNTAVRSQQSGKVRFRGDDPKFVSQELNIEQFGFLTDDDFTSSVDVNNTGSIDSSLHGSHGLHQTPHQQEFEQQPHKQLTKANKQLIAEDYAALRRLEESGDEGGEGEEQGELDENGNQIVKPKKLKKKRKKKKKVKQPAQPPAGPEDEEDNAFMPLPLSEIDRYRGGRSDSPTSATSSKRSYIAPRPPQRTPIMPDKPGDEFKRIHVSTPSQIVAQQQKKASLIMPPIVSNIAREAKPIPNAELLKQYDVALKQLSAYRKEREMLIQRLDNSAIEVELEKYRGIIQEKDAHIGLLLDEVRGLKNQTKHQSDFLAAISRDKDFVDDETKTMANYVLVLEERVKRLKSHLEVAQRRDRLSGVENEKLKARCEKLLKQKNRYKNQLLASQEKCTELEMNNNILTEVTGLSPRPNTNTNNYNNSVDDNNSAVFSVTGPGDELTNLLPMYHRPTSLVPPAMNISDDDGDHDHDDLFDEDLFNKANHSGRGESVVADDINNVAVPVIVVESGLGVGIVPERSTASVGSVSVASKKSSAGAGAAAGGGHHNAHLFSEQAEHIRRLQKNLEMQRESFIRQIAHVQSELKQSHSENINLKLQLSSLEHNARAQVILTHVDD
jgi:hypothetical protein